MTDAATRFELRGATEADIPQLLELIRGLAEYEQLSQLLECTPQHLHAALFEPPAAAEAVIAWTHTGAAHVAAGFALFFHNYSTFLGRKGLYLEDLYVRPEWRGHGCGEALLRELARLAVARGCGRFEWSVLDWNTSAQRFYEGMGATVLPDWRIVRVTGKALEDLAARTAPPSS